MFKFLKSLRQDDSRALDKAIAFRAYELAEIGEFLWSDSTVLVGGKSHRLTPQHLLHVARLQRTPWQRWQAEGLV